MWSPLAPACTKPSPGRMRTFASCAASAATIGLTSARACDHQDRTGKSRNLGTGTKQLATPRQDRGPKEQNQTGDSFDECFIAGNCRNPNVGGGKFTGSTSR